MFDHTTGEDRQLLFFKERFVGADFEFGNDVVSFTKRLKKLGFSEDTIGYGPSLSEFESLRVGKGLSATLRKLS